MISRARVHAGTRKGAADQGHETPPKGCATANAGYFFVLSILGGVNRIPAMLMA
jgi:hypothetical protein